MDLSLLGQSRDAEGRRRAAHPRSWPLGRRSGRVPALRYPPPGYLQRTPDHRRHAIHHWAARSFNGAGEFHWQRQPRLRKGYECRHGEADCPRGAGAQIDLIYIVSHKSILRTGGVSATGSR
jgi:hypothetical protein